MFTNDFEFEASISLDEQGNIILRPVLKDDSYLKNYYTLLKSKGKSIVNLVLVNDSNYIKSRKQERMYRASLKKLAEYLSDIEKRYTPELLHTKFKYEFCEYKLENEGIDLFRKYNREINGEIIEVSKPKSFDKKIDGKLFSEYISFFRRTCVSKYNIDPFEDFIEREYKTELIKKNESN